MSKQYFKKMTLLEEAEYERLREKLIRDYNPTLKSLAEIQSSIEDLFQNPNLKPDEKIQLLNHLQSKFGALYTEAKYAGLRPTTNDVTVVTGNAKDVDKKKEVYKDKDKTQVLKDVEDRGVATDEEVSYPKFSDLNLTTNYGKKYNELEAFLSKYPHVINRSPNGEIVVHGRTIPNSSFRDSIRHLYTTSKTRHTGANDEFMSALRSLNLPNHLITSKAAKASLKSPMKVSPKFSTSSPESPIKFPLKQTGKGK